MHKIYSNLNNLVIFYFWGRSCFMEDVCEVRTGFGEDGLFSGDGFGDSINGTGCGDGYYYEEKIRELFTFHDETT